MRPSKYLFAGLPGLLLALVMLWTPPRASAQNEQLLLNLAPIQGSSVLSGYQNWIEISSFSWGFSRSYNQSFPPVASPPDFGELSFSKNLDASSSNLVAYCAQGVVIPQAVLVGAIVGSHTGRSTNFFRLQLSNAVITSITVNADTSGNQTSERVSLDFNTKLIWTYSQFRTNGATLNGTANYSMAYDKVRQVGAALVPFQTTVNPSAGSTTIAWVAAPYAVYQILRSTSPAGPFVLYTTYNNGAGTDASLTIPTAGTLFFYSVQGQF